MKKLNAIGEKLVNKIKDRISIEEIIKKNKLQSVFKKIMILAVIIFAVVTIIIYGTLKYSYNYQNKVYEDGYLAYTYANKINEDILNTKISVLINSSYKGVISENLDLYRKDIEDNIEKYKMVNNISDKEKKLIDEFIELNTSYNDKLSKITNDIESKIVNENEMKEIILTENKRIKLSNKLINCASNRINMLNKENKKIKIIVIQIILIINFAMIGLFTLMIFVVKKISQMVEYYALYNSITGLPNKNHVINTIAKEIKDGYKDKFALLISLDIDNFKAVNDNLGHDLGDKLLHQIGNRFRRAIHIQDYLYHMGGDEFLFLINSVYNKNQAEIMVNKIQNVFKEPFNIEGKKIDYVTASLGIAIINQDGNDFEILYNYADDAMYEAKRLGKNRCIFYEEEMYSNVYEKIIKKKWRVSN